ncbi:MAG: hypothetical protein KY456_10110 [Chloroflexi bacterium]|nr:hypothetical protein [Chloroflexota bacterium]
MFCEQVRLVGIAGAAVEGVEDNNGDELLGSQERKILLCTMHDLHTIPVFG